MEISVPMILVITLKADVFSSDWTCVDGFSVITLKMDMKACFVVINSVDSCIFCVGSTYVSVLGMLKI